jgi:hypothetical protein
MDCATFIFRMQRPKEAFENDVRKLSDSSDLRRLGFPETPLREPRVK